MPNESQREVLEIGPDVVIAEMDGLRAEVRGPLARQVRAQLAEFAIECIRGARRQERYAAEMQAQTRTEGADIADERGGLGPVYDRLTTGQAINRSRY